MLHLKHPFFPRIDLYPLHIRHPLGDDRALRDRQMAVPNIAVDHELERVLALRLFNSRFSASSRLSDIEEIRYSDQAAKLQLGGMSRACRQHFRFLRPLT